MFLLPFLLLLISSPYTRVKSLTPLQAALQAYARWHRRLTRITGPAILLILIWY